MTGRSRNLFSRYLARLVYISLRSSNFDDFFLPISISIIKQAPGHNHETDTTYQPKLCPYDPTFVTHIGTLSVFNINFSIEIKRKGIYIYIYI